MCDDAVISGSRMEIECDDMNFMTARFQRSGKLPGPMLEAASSGIKSFENESDFHRDTDQ